MIPDWFQEGAKVVITDNNNCHSFKIGQVVILGKKSRYYPVEDSARICYHLSGQQGVRPNVRCCDCRPVEPPSVEDLLG